MHNRPALILTVLLLACLYTGALFGQCPSPGYSGTYNVTYKSRTVTDLSGISKSTRGTTPQQITVISLSAELRCMSSENGERFLWLRAVRLQYSVNDVPQTYVAERVARELEHPVVAVFDSTGKFIRLRASDSTSNESLAMLGTLLGQLQLPPIIPKTSEISIPENDRTGEYVVTYRHIPSETKSELYYRKYKGDYTINTSLSAVNVLSQNQSAELRGVQDIVYSPNACTVERISGSDTQHVRLGDVTVAENVGEYSMTRSGGVTKDMIPPKDTLRVTVKIPEVYDKATVQRAALESIFNGSSVAGVLDTLDQNIAADTAQSLYLPNKLRALIALYPTTADSLLVRAKMYKANDFRVRIVAAVFSDNGSVENQQRLLSLIEQHRDSTQALIHLLAISGDVERPVEQLTSRLQRFAFQGSDNMVRSTAQLALGALCALISRYDPPRADTIMLDILAHADSLDEKQLLYIIGNAGLRITLPIIRNIVNRPQSRLKAVALYSLRFIAGADVDTLLARGLAAKDTVLRSASVEALQFRGYTQPTMVALFDIITGGTESDDKKLATIILARWARGNQNVRTYVEQRMKKELIAPWYRMMLRNAIK